MPHRILSLNQIVFYILKEQILLCLKHANIPSNGGEFRGTKKLLLPPIFFSIMVYVCFQDNQLVIIVMSLVSSRHTPEKQEYFQSSTDRVYKVCRRYFIQQKTLETFGIIIDQGKWALPKVMEYDSMLSNPDGQIKNEVDKPFCCKFCGSENFIKYGMKNKKQEYQCKDCGRRFIDNMYFENLKANPKIICLTLDLYFKGVSLRKIVDHLKQFHNLKVSHTTLLRWIENYISIMDNYVSQFKPKLGSVWQVDEMMVSVDGDWFYLWNVMDEFTRFHLASVISKERKVENARKVFQVAKKRSHGDRPQCIVSDGLQSYKKAVNKEFHTVKKETIHVGNTGIRGKYYRNAKFYNNGVERLHGTMRERNKTQRGLEKEDSAFILGHQLYYNFIRPHQALNNYTPAHFANIYLNLGDKKWKNLLLQSVKNQREVEIEK
jgi:transposase-like protein